MDIPSLQMSRKTSFVVKDEKSFDLDVTLSIIDKCGYFVLNGDILAQPFNVLHDSNVNKDDITCSRWRFVKV